MKLTEEQIAIINSSGNIRINAVAGSGKTTTIIEYAKTRPAGSKILYLAFNRSVKFEAVKKFADQGLDHVKVETAHSLAYRYVVPKNNYKVRAQSYKSHEIADILKLSSNSVKHGEYMVANHILKFVTYFCNSDKQDIHELNYLDVVNDNKAKAFAATFYDYIEKKSLIFLNKMDSGEIEITHDFYLKKFQLSGINLPYDYILFDEGQDASSAMLDIFLKQKAVKVIVGDTHQQIYGWRFAVNSLEKVDFSNYSLTTSFRFGEDVAKLAIEILNWKNHLSEHKTVMISGNGKNKETKSKAILARTNLGLLLKAIEHVTEKNTIKKIYFEGNINSYTYADDGASLYDVLNLYNNNHFRIKDRLVKSMRDIYELEEYIKSTEDVQLGMMVEIVREYGNRIPGIIKEIKNKHVENDEKDQAEVIFSTVHRAKGMEYDSVQLVNDFITLEKIEKAKFDHKSAEMIKSKINEEINLLYVAITRAKNSLYIPEALLPKDFLPSEHIHVMKVVIDPIDKNVSSVKTLKIGSKSGKVKEYPKEKAFSVSSVREKHKDAYRPWTPEQDTELTIMYCEGINQKDLAKHFGRTPGAIQMRIKKLELEESYG